MRITAVNILKLFVLVQYETVLGVWGRILPRGPVSPGQGHAVKAHVPFVVGTGIPVGTKPNAIRQIQRSAAANSSEVQIKRIINQF